MTVGQRIAQKRKELGLSQEGLGAQLGVSRQAIYKWESDATLPEIDKLVALSRIFQVSVGWLLGEEAQHTPDAGEELTELQLRMVEEIVDRYLAARPAPEQTAAAQPSPARRKWRIAAALLAVGVGIPLFVNLFGRLDTLDSRYQNLQNSIGSIHSSVNNQVSSIANRVEQILESQNQLTAERSSSVKATDLAANTVTFTARAVPRTYREGMTALLVARSAGEITEVPVPLGPGNAFEGEITCPLTDQIELSVVFVSEGQRQTQLLNEWLSLYSSSFPMVWLLGGPLWFDVDDKTNTLEPGETWLDTTRSQLDEVKGGQAEIADIRVGLFQDKKLLCWYTETVRPVIVNGVQTEETRYLREDTIPLDPNSVYTQAAVVTDVYGRVRVYSDSNLEYSQGDWNPSTAFVYSEDPSFWDFG